MNNFALLNQKFKEMFEFELKCFKKNTLATCEVQP